MSKSIRSQNKDYASWYTDVVVKAGLADYGPVKGTMVIKPYGFALWELIKDSFDKMIKDTGHENAYFPLFIPKSFLAKEADHIEGFAKECAVVTHTRLKSDSEKGIIVDPESRLEEEVIVRPTSETVIWSMYKKWIQSYRDLPLLINQWANVVRWEMRTRLFLRTTEFLWQEGHTAHETYEEAEKETLLILEFYRKLAEDYLAMPVHTGLKSESEKFAGAEETYCIESLMQDGKALQAGTSHFLAQNFSKAFDVKFTNKEGKLEHVWATSWGVSTRLMGALIMSHGDDNGLVLPPKLAPYQIVIIPVFKSENELKQITNYVESLMEQIKSHGFSVKFDNRINHKPGFKFNEYEIKGVPIRIVVGPRDLKEKTLEIFRRDKMEKKIINFNKIIDEIIFLVDDIQNKLLKKSEKFMTNKTKIANSYAEFKNMVEDGGFVLAHWDGTIETEQKIKQETKATIRVIPADNIESGICIFSGKKSDCRVYFARSY